MSDVVEISTEPDKVEVPVNWGTSIWIKSCTQPQFIGMQIYLQASQCALLPLPSSLQRDALWLWLHLNDSWGAGKTQPISTAVKLWSCQTSYLLLTAKSHLPALDPSLPDIALSAINYPPYPPPQALPAPPGHVCEGDESGGLRSWYGWMPTVFGQERVKSCRPTLPPSYPKTREPASVRPDTITPAPHNNIVLPSPAHSWKPPNS